MKGFFLLSGPGFSIGFLILFSLFLWLWCLILLFDRPQVCGDHLCAGLIFPFRRLPASLIEFTDNHQELATLEEIEFELSQFSNGHDVDPISASLPCTSTVRGLTR
jgi:hypothetical protein